MRLHKPFDPFLNGRRIYRRRGQQRNVCVPEIKQVLRRLLRRFHIVGANRGRRHAFQFPVDQHQREAFDHHLEDFRIEIFPLRREYDQSVHPKLQQLPNGRFLVLLNPKCPLRDEKTILLPCGILHPVDQPRPVAPGEIRQHDAD
ncbi:hypothetical protein D3C81_1104230 [compost metagenome]